MQIENQNREINLKFRIQGILTFLKGLKFVFTIKRKPFRFNNQFYQKITHAFDTFIFQVHKKGYKTVQHAFHKPFPFCAPNNQTLNPQKS